MLALKRSIQGTGLQSKFLDYKCGKNFGMHPFPGIFSLQLKFSTLGIGRDNDALYQQINYLHNFIKTSVDTSFSSHGGVTNRASYLHTKFFNFCQRSMSTVGNLKDTVVQNNSTVPSDNILPERIKVKRLDKTAKYIMNILDKEAVDRVRSERNIPEIESGYIIEMKVEAPENKGRTSTIKGLVIGKRNSSIGTTIRVRRLESGVGTESVFPLYSPNIKDIKVLEKRSVRRAKLYYIKDRPYNVALRELAQRTAKKKEMALRVKRIEQSNKK